MITAEQLLGQSYVPVVRTVTQPRLEKYGELRVRYGLDNIYVPATEAIPMMRYNGRTYLDARLANTGHKVGHNRVPTSVMAVKQDDGSLIIVDTRDEVPEVRIAFEWKEGMAFILKSTLDQLIQEQTQLQNVS